VGIDAAGDVFSLISVLFEPKLDVLGLIIYGTELILWIGVFACGGYFNLMPWIWKKLGQRASARSASPTEQAPNGEPVTMHNLPSSTSVFRTPSGAIELRRTQAASTSGANLDREGSVGGELHRRAVSG
jgi:hypothetical protein